MIHPVCKQGPSKSMVVSWQCKSYPTGRCTQCLEKDVESKTSESGLAAAMAPTSGGRGIPKGGDCTNHDGAGIVHLYELARPRDHNTTLRT